MQRWTLAGCLAALVASWLVSNHYPPWVTSHSELLASIGAVLLALAGLTSGKGNIEIPRSAVFAFAIATIPLIQGVTGLIPFIGDSWIAALYLSCAGWVVIWSSHLSRSNAEQVMDYLATGILAGGLASAWIMAVQVAGTDIGPLALHIATVPNGHAPFANLGNRISSLTCLDCRSSPSSFSSKEAGLPGHGRLPRWCCLSWRWRLRSHEPSCFFSWSR